MSELFPGSFLCSEHGLASHVNEEERMKTSPLTKRGWLMLGLVAAVCLPNTSFGQSNPLRHERTETPSVTAQRTTPNAPIEQVSATEPIGSNPNKSSSMEVTLPIRNYVPGHLAIANKPAVSSRVESASYDEYTVKSNRSVVTERKILQDAPVPETIDVGGTVVEQFDSGFSSGCTDCAGSGGCGPGGCCGTCFTCCLLPIPIPVICMDNFELSMGVHGFTGPANRGETGSFGFNEGINWATSLPCAPCGELGVQLGAEFDHSNFSGAEFTNDDRNQIFVTGGVFRRVDWGMQGGVVVDYMSDNWYFNADLVQVRGELSWMFPQGHEIGAWFTVGTNDDTSTFPTIGAVATTETFQPTDLFAFFYRTQFDGCGAQGRLFGGFTGDSDGLIGGDIRLPINSRWALDAGFTFLVPEEATGARGHESESWNVGINLVWYPGSRTATGRDYYRPLFNVANNGSFLVDRN